MSSAPQLALSHIGFKPNSPKKITLVPQDGNTDFPETIPFYIRKNAYNLPREKKLPPGAEPGYQTPFNLVSGRLLLEQVDPDQIFFTGELKRIESRWGTFWQGDFSDFETEGTYQIDTDFQTSVPFLIGDSVYDRLLLGYLRFLKSQRCGCSVFGVHPLCHADDGVLEDGTPFDATGGWHDAGDSRKWLFFIQYHLDSLVTLHETHFANGAPADAGPAADEVLDEIRWGNRFFHKMITEEGHVYEDVAGGIYPSENLTYPEGWWFENHPGLNANGSDCRNTDNVPNSGDERQVRTTLNPLVQFGFVHTQCLTATVLPENEASKCLELAQRAWKYGKANAWGDKRTLFHTARLRAALELKNIGVEIVSNSEILDMLTELLARQETNSSELINGYFYEESKEDAFRSIAFATHPPLAILRAWELRDNIDLPADIISKCQASIERYCDLYLLADMQSNPFELVPYGVFLKPDKPDFQSFRPAGSNRWIRTFMPPFNKLDMAHGLNGVIASHAHTLAKAGKFFKRTDWQQAAHKCIHWMLGHNPNNASLFDGIGYRQPIPFGLDTPQIPDGALNGYIGDVEDKPYLEQSTAIWWSTQEYWSSPYIHITKAICYLHKQSHD
ncbi:glycoside hydrolase family 9 protein [Pelagicoccus mobilis]|uniref:Glycoside hydrolase family 9 protein n=1 Tax=Pelagicoccus mobilis TaxID=415221 RepID=A0A934VTU8_9BACT|nr:glycoside hydrolase family 9 protein [Pelagicoccus mobilis]MBK1880445.1 glycoside hydrolase family 9 protein [Pelagicoccus mobilis]